MSEELRKADLRKLHATGRLHPGVEDRVALRLARAIHASESAHCVTSWSAQERAQNFFNEHGFSRALDECERLESQIPNQTEEDRERDQ